MEHAITIDNISDCEVFDYPLVLLKGTVINPNDSSLPNEIIVNSSPCKLQNNKFKCLLELETGENRIDLRHGDTKKEFIVIHTARKSDLVVCPIYIICDGHDGHFQAPKCEENDIDSACNRITTGCKLLQLVVAEKLNECNFGRRTFILDECKIFYSSLECQKARSMQQEELWLHLGREIMESDLGSGLIKFVGFLSCTLYHGELYSQDFATHEELLGITDAYVALGGGGLALFGTACLYTWPKCVNDVMDKFMDEEIIDKNTFLDDSAYRGTRGACFSTTLGSVLHELCHTFDLGHTRDGIMGRGFDNIRNMFLPIEKATTKLAEIESMPSQKFGDLVSFKIKDVESKSFIRNAQFSEDIINKSVRIDDTFFTKSSSCILSYHKWFNSLPSPAKNFILSYDENIKLVKSTMGIRVIEVRRNEDEMVMLNWCFIGKILKYNFHIDGASLETLDENNYTLFVEDNAGNILKIAIM